MSGFYVCSNCYRHHNSASALCLECKAPQDHRGGKGMSRALPGEHYCVDHQGNHSHYDPHNCTVCKLQKQIGELVSNLETAVSVGLTCTGQMRRSAARITCADWEQSRDLRHLADNADSTLNNLHGVVTAAKVQRVQP